MRSSVAESHPSGEDTTRPRSEFRSPRPQHQIPHPAAYRERQRSFSLAPSEGWLAMLLLAIALYSVVFSIISSDWVDNSFILPWSAAAGLLVGLCVAKIQRFPQAILHLGACLTGYWLSIYLTSVLASPHIPWLVLLGNLRAVIGGGLTTSGAASSESFSLLSHVSLFFSWLLWRLVDLSRSSALAGSVSLLCYHAGESQLRKKGPFLPACHHAWRPDPADCPHSTR